MASSASAKTNSAPLKIQRLSGQPYKGLRAAPASVDRIPSSTGRPLEPALRKDMEQQFGYDFSQVRTHSDAAAEKSAREVKRAKLARKSEGEPAPNHIPAIVHEVLASAGAPLDRETRERMEPHFGQDFSEVRIHTNARAAESARAVGAVAYTVGRDVVFGDRSYAPGTQAGNHILAHELAHVVQQGYRPAGDLSALSIEDEHTPSEVEADRAASAVTAGHAAHLASAPAGLRRIRCTDILMAREDPIINAQTGKKEVGGKQFESVIRREAVVQLRERLVEGVRIPGGSARAKQDDCGEATPAKGAGFPDIAYRASKDEVELAEIKIGTIPCMGVGDAQVQGYIDKGNSNQKLLNELGIQRFKRMPMSRIKFERRYSTNQNRDLLIGWCSDGVIVYKPVSEKKDEKKEQEKDKGNDPLARHREMLRVLAAPGAEIASGFTNGFIKGARQAVPEVALTAMYERLKEPADYLAFMAAQIPGRIVGMLGSIGDLIVGLVDLVKLSAEFSVVGIAATELAALAHKEESPTLRRARIAKAIVEGLPALGVELRKNPDLLFDTANEFGVICGQEAGKRFVNEFASASPAQMGYIVGQIQGYLAVEVVMLCIGAEEIAAVGKLISGGARALRASRFATRLIEILEKVPALTRAMELIKQAHKVEEAAKVAKGVRVAQEGADAASAAKKVRVAQEGADAAREAELLEEAEQAQLAARKMKAGEKP
nr:DUF4157 domain-containing protein [Azotobacter chroococcum]